MSSKPIAIACDHAGYELKDLLVQDLKTRGFEIVDLGTDGTQSVDYPDFAYALAAALDDGRAERGVLVCGSGIGISIAANRHPNIRAALCSEPLSARMARLHNDANVIVFGGRMIGSEIARECLTEFLNTEFEGGRHGRRVDKLSNPKL